MTFQTFKVKLYYPLSENVTERITDAFRGILCSEIYFPISFPSCIRNIFPFTSGSNALSLH
ncbi:MAG: hypothetical protein K2H28_07855, partial [Ruminococcus sp.]|nr:hypothetical protein [Ruminococcus sp.]